MTLHSIRLVFLALLFLLCSCSKDPSPTLPEPDPIQIPDSIPVPVPEIIPNSNPIGAVAGTVQFFNKDLMDNNYILVNDARYNFVYIMDKSANVLHQWNLQGGNMGNDSYLLENGKLLAMLEADDPKILLGGYGGKIALLKKDGAVEWSFVYSTEDYIIHHDAEMLPNGNVLIMTWERKSIAETEEAGYQLSVELFPDGIIEVNPTNNEIVWEWHLFDHIIQNVDGTKADFGDVSLNPQLIDINYNVNENGDITHANGIAYDPEKDVIYLSVNAYSEIWVIDHSTTSAQAATHSGGNLGKGGDLVYRFGNPSAYQNTAGERLFINNHFPNLLTGEDRGKMLLFSNGGETEISTIYELQLPEVFNLRPNQNNEPIVLWSYTNPELYAPRVSGAVKLENGNLLITEGDYGLWEVTRQKEVVWKFHNDGFYWRAYHHLKSSPEINLLGL